MEINKDIVFKKISNQKFCSAKEALDYAIKFRHESIRRIVFKRRDVFQFFGTIPSKEAIDYVIKVFGDQKIKDTVFSRSDVIEYVTHYLDTLSTKESIEYATKVGDWRIWSIVLTRPDVSSKEAFSYATEIHEPGLWEVVFKNFILM